MMWEEAQGTSSEWAEYLGALFLSIFPGLVDSLV